MTIDLVNPGRSLHVGIILMNSETEFLDLAPIDFLNGLSKAFLPLLPVPEPWKAKALDITWHWVSETGESKALTCGGSAGCTDSFETCPALDIVLMAAHRPGYTPNEAELCFVRKAYEDSSAFLTICGGFDAPLRAGLLNGKTATAPRFMLETLRTEAPGTKWVEKRWARDGKLWTSGALLNGLDLMVAFVRDTYANMPEVINAMVELGGWPDRGAEYP